ncbi:hypothetical protein DUNSADRAFT_8413, partial [Dunaliella salina]
SLSHASSDSFAGSATTGTLIGSSAMSGSAVGRSAAPGAVPLATAVPNHGALCADLTQMGFNALQVQMALEYAARVAHDKGVTRDDLLAWLLVHVPPDQLPQRFNKGSSTNAVTVVSAASRQQQQQRQPGRGQSSTLDDGSDQYSALTEVQRQSVDRLCLWGYTPQACQAALQEAEGDEARALPLLLAGLTGCEVLHADPDAASNES